VTIAASSAITSLAHACYTGGSAQAIAAVLDMNTVLDMNATHAWLQSVSQCSKSGASKRSIKHMNAGNHAFAAHCTTSADLGFGCIYIHTHITLLVFRTQQGSQQTITGKFPKMSS